MAVPVAAQTFGGSTQDPHINILRTVNPRVAYRGIPKDDMPVRARATTFPSTEFDHAIQTQVVELGDGMLGGESGTGGIAPRIINATVGVPMALTGAMPMSSASVPLGMGATLGGAGGVTGAVSQIAPTVTGALSNLGTMVQGAGK